MSVSHLFIVGAAKAGTTSLYQYLSQHPHIAMAHMKEPHYFSQVRPTESQARHVPVISKLDEYETLFTDQPQTRYRGEASPSYLWASGTAERIHAYDAQARILILLRDPIQRAYSHYLMDVREARQTQSFYDALLNDQRTVPKGWGISHLYVELGMYCEQVRRYLDTFGRQQVHVLFYEDFIADIPAALESVYAFLDLEAPTAADEHAVHNPYARPRNAALHKLLLGNQALRRIGSMLLPDSARAFVRNRLLLKQTDKPPLSDQAYDYLHAQYAEDVDCLQALLKREMPWDTFQ